LFDGVRPALRRAAPRVGEHNVEVYATELGLGADQLSALRSADIV
jgi:crotonobetainyl-CoA:carnitine CoA-transferase CaiB-like acyl-CoA transferase